MPRVVRSVEAAGGTVVRERHLVKPLDEMQLEVLRLMRDATAAGVMTWRESTDSNFFKSASGPISSWIHFEMPAYIGEAGSDRDFVEVGFVGRFMVGTAGWMLALEILAAGDASWRKHVGSLRAGYEKRIDLLKKAVGVAQKRKGRRVGARRKKPGPPGRR